MSQVTAVGVAVTVTDSPGIVASAVNVPHAAGSIHSQVGSPTTCAASAGGDVYGCGTTSGTWS
jgi:hypothetical protein